jgi:prophage regulatory protein
MQVSLDAADIQAIADKVIKTLLPILTEIRETTRRAALPLPQVAPPVIENNTVKAEIVRRNEVVRMTGLSSTTLWRLEGSGQFPARILLTEKRVGWRRTEVEAWLNSKRTVKVSAET